MNAQEKFDKQFRKYPHKGKSFFTSPHLTRRSFLNLCRKRSLRASH